MAKIAEKLIILGEFGSGLLCRVHHLRNFEVKSDLFPKECDSYLKSIPKNFTKMEHETMSKLKGHNEFRARGTVIQEALVEYYKTFIDVLNFRDEAMKAMTELTSTILSLKFEVNSDLMTKFFDLFERFVSLHFLITQVDNRKLYIGAYAHAYECTTNHPEPNFHSIAAFFERLDRDRSKTTTDKINDVLKYLTEDLNQLSRHVGETLMSFQKPIMKWDEVKALVDGRVFNLMEDPKSMCVPKGEANHLELMHVARMKQWALLGFLCFPSELQRPGAMQMVACCLGDTVVMEIFREVSFNVHETYEALAKWYKQDKWKLNSRANLKALRDHKDWAQTMFKHRQLRVYLRVELEALIPFFTEFPATLAPKLQLVFAILHLARDELLWYFRHESSSHLLSKKQILEKDPRLTDLIYLGNRLSHVVQRHSKLIQEYFHKSLVGPDFDQLNPLVEKFLAESKADTSIRTLLGLIMNGIKNERLGQSYEAVRLNWYRCSAALNGIQSGVKPPEIKALSVPISKVIMHTRNVDTISQKLKLHGGMAALFFFRDNIERELKSCLEGAGNARNAISLVSAMGEAMDNVHRICPEEQLQIGRAVISMVDRMLKDVGRGVEKLCSAIFEQILKLRRQTESKGVIKLISQKGSPLPGHESRGKEIAEISRLQRRKRALNQICASVQEIDKLIVFNYEFCPREYVFHAMVKHIKKNLQDCCMSKEAMQMRRPSEALTRFNVVVQTYQFIEEYLSVKLSDVVRSVMLGEFTDPLVGRVGESLFTNTASTESKTAAVGGKPKKHVPRTVHHYADWFYHMFKTNPERIGVVFSPSLKSFWGLKVQTRAGGDVQMIDIETKTDYNELRALTKLIGPYGVRVIEKKLLTLVGNMTLKLKGMIAAAQSALTKFRGKSQFVGAFLAARKDPALSDDKLKQFLDVASSIGVVLEFRKLLKEALRDTTERAVPYIYGAVDLAHEHAHDLFKISIREISHLDLLARDAGIPGVDAHLHDSLYKLKAKPEDAMVWDLLPEMFAIAMSSTFWATAQFQIATEACKNNGHCLGECIKALIQAFTTIQVPSASKQPDPPHVIDARLTETCERFVEDAANVLLHTAAGHKEGMSSIADGVVFLESFVNNSNERVALSFLEDCFPFTLVRTTFIRIYEQQTSKGRRYELKQESQEAT